MVKLNVCYIIEKDKDVFELSLKSVLGYADHFIIVDGNEKQKNVSADDSTVIHAQYPHFSKGADGHQRNIYLEELKKNHMGEWAIALDADEFIDHPEKIKPFIELLEDQRFDACSPNMRHLINGLSQEDATQPVHYCPMRLFKVTPNLFYDEVEHPVLSGGERYAIGSEGFCIWHMGSAREVFRKHDKYLNNIAKSNIHNRSFLDWWYNSHLFNTYPVKQVPFSDLPKVLLKHLDVNEDLIYFGNRMQPELKHWEDARMWIDFFKPKTALEVGCGAGHRARCLLNLGVDAYGFDISEWAIKNSLYPEMKGRLLVQDATKPLPYNKTYDLIILYDLLEHLSPEEIDNSIENIKKLANRYLLVSVPMIGDPNLTNDSTHKIFWTKEQWISKFAEHNLATIPTPNHFLYKEQIIILSRTDVE